MDSGTGICYLGIERGQSRVFTFPRDILDPIGGGQTQSGTITGVLLFVIIVRMLNRDVVLHLAYGA